MHVELHHIIRFFEVSVVCQASIGGKKKDLFQHPSFSNSRTAFGPPS